MLKTVKAIYQQGNLRLLESVDLQDGQEVQLTIQTHEDRVREIYDAMADIFVEYPDAPSLDDIDEEAILKRLHDATRGLPPLSEEIIKERQEGW